LWELHRSLQEDEGFWAELNKLPHRLEQEGREEVERLLQNFDRFLVFEERELVKVAQLPRQEVVRFLEDINDAVRDRNRAFRMVSSRSDMDAIENLRDRSKELQETLYTAYAEISAVLASTEPQPVEDPRRYRWVHDVRKSLLFVSGAVLASVNLFLLDPSTSQAPSVIGGIQSMIQQFPEGLLRTVGNELLSKGKEASERARSLWESFRGG